MKTATVNGNEQSVALRSRSVDTVVNVTIKFTRPYLMNNPASMSRGSVSGKGQANIPTPEEEAASKLYWDRQKESIVLPSQHVKGAMIRASSGWKAGKIRLTPYIAGSLDIDPIDIPFSTKEYEIDVRRVVVQRAAILRARPMIPEGRELDFDLIVSKDFTSEIKNCAVQEGPLHQILMRAGSSVGVGDFTPAHKGPFGKFEVIKWETD